MAFIFSGVMVVKNLPVKGGYARDRSNPWLGRSPGEGNGNPLQFYTWKTPWTKKPGGLHPMRSKKLDTTEHTHTPTHTENLKRKKEPALGSIMCARSIQGYFLN